jgi:hypothetical protein
MAAVLLAGCGGGSGSANNSAAPSAANTALGSYINDELAGGFTGSWYTGTTVSATANTESLAATAVPTVFNLSHSTRTLAGGVWSNAASTGGWGYELAPSGWVLGGQSGATRTDKGDGVHAVDNFAGGISYPFSIARTSLAGSAVACVNGPCIQPNAVYPPGAASYTLTDTTDHYLLLTSTMGLQVSDAWGVPLARLPTVNETFCDPLLGYVYQPTSAASVSWTNFYAVYTTASCLGSSIGTALAGFPVAYVTVSVEATGNAYVPNVLSLTNWSAGYGFVYPTIYALRNGYVWEGVKEPQGSRFTVKNKAAINAELLGSGFAAIP